MIFFSRLIGIGPNNLSKSIYPKLYTPEILEFKKVEEGITFLKDSKDIWVSKASMIVP